MARRMAQAGTKKWRAAVGARIRDARHFKGMTQAELGGACWLIESAICHYETARRMPSAANLVRLSEALEVSTDYILGLAP